MRTKTTVERFPVPESVGEWQAGLNKSVLARCLTLHVALVSYAGGAAEGASNRLPFCHYLIAGQHC